MNRKTVLIVEDEAIVAADLAGKLGQLGYEVVGIVARGDEAVESAARLQPGVVLMDIRLQGPMDGIEAAEAIRGRSDVPVIYLTAHSDAATLARAKLSEPFGYILKPFEERELATNIEIALHKHQADSEKRRSQEAARKAHEELEMRNAELKAINETLRSSRVAALNLMEDAVAARREAEKASLDLRESEERYRNLFNTMDEGFCIVEMIFDTEGRPVDYRFLEINPAFEKQTGLLDAKGKLMRELAPAHEAHWFEIYGKIALTGEPARFVNEARALNRWYEVYAYRVGRSEDRYVAILFNDISERKRAEAVTGHLAALVESADDAIISKDLNGVIQSWNIGAENMFGYTAAEAVGRNISFLIPEGYEDDTMEIIGRILEGEHVDNFESARLRKDGTIVPVSLTYSAIKDASGKVVGISKIVHDITRRKQDEAELQRLNKVLKALSNSSQAVIRVNDEPEYLKDVCRIIREDCGYSMVWIGYAEHDEAKSVRPVAFSGFEGGYLETLNLTWADTERGRGPTGTAIRTGKIAACRNMLTDPAFEPWREEAIKRGYASSIVFPLRRDSGVFGAITAYSEEADPFSESEVRFLGKLADNVAYGINVLRIRAAQKQAEEALKESLRRFELLTVTAGELLQSTEPQTVVESVCHKIMKYLDCHAFFNFLVDEQAGRLHLNACAGIPAEEAAKIEWLDFGTAICGCAARDGRRIVAEHIPTTPDERTELVKSFGVKAYCCHPLLGPGGNVIGTLSFGTCGRETFSEEDLSLMKAVTDQVAVAMIRMKDEAEVLRLSEDMAARNVALEGVNKELEAFIYSVSHDLRAPIRSMSGFAKFLVEDYADTLDDQGKDYLKRIDEGAAKMTRIINDLLYLSRINRQEINRMQIDLSRLASSVVSELRAADPGRVVEVTISNGVIASADRQLMEVVFSNLLGNAWKFTAKTGNARIEFGALEQEGKMVYYVSDNGAGFDPKYKEKMFQPFQRLHSDQEFEGMGIGLAIVERVIHRHCGRVWAEGQTERGAKIYFTLGEV